MRHTRLLGLLGPTLLLLACATGAPGDNLREPRLLEPSRWTGDPVVRTRYGLVRGFRDADETWVWKTIPFAAPPVGRLRWRAPVDPAPWTGVRSVRRFNSGCTQFNPLLKGSVRGSEDCLYLNVWRPRSSTNKLPVYVWIHGGGNSIGSATMVKDYYGNRVASRSKMVFVSINYRLGPMGWFTSPALREGESPQDASGNYGTLDILQALKWVRQNIEAFGGDPDLVTIAGESAGAMDVLSLLISPLAHGLFSRAISESGAPLTSSPAEGDRQSAAVADKLLIADRRASNEDEAESLRLKMTNEELRDYLRSKSAKEILKTYGGGAAGMIRNPAIFLDGTVLPREGYSILKSGDYPNKVPLLIGSNKEEVKLFLFLSRMKWRSPLYQAVARFGSERWRAEGVDQIAAEMAAAPGQPPVYVYRFDWGAPDAEGRSVLPGTWGRRLGAFHSLEIPFFLGTDTVNGVMNIFLYNRANAGGRKKLSSAAMSYIASFARTGNPNKLVSGLPNWQAWSNEPDGPKSMIFDADESDLRLRMSNTALTETIVMDVLDRELPEPLRSETRDYLRRSRLP